MQACNFCSPQSQEKCKCRRQRNCFDILTPMRVLAQSNCTYILPLSWGCSNTSWGGIRGRNCTVPGMETLNSGITKLFSCFIEGGGICLTTVSEAAYSFVLPLVCPRKQRRRRRDRAVNININHISGSHLVCWCISQLITEWILYFVLRYPCRWCVYSQARTQSRSQHYLSNLRTLKHYLTLKPSEYLPIWVAVLSKMPLQKKRWNFWGED